MRGRFFSKRRPNKNCITKQNINLSKNLIPKISKPIKEKIQIQISHTNLTQKSLSNSEIRFIGQCWEKVLIFQKNEKLMTIDQHAIHERIRYEAVLKKLIAQSLGKNCKRKVQTLNLRKKVLGHDNEVQIYKVTKKKQQISHKIREKLVRTNSATPRLNNLGFKFDFNKKLLLAAPELLGIDLSPYLESLIPWLDQRDVELESTVPKALDSKIRQISCKSAIKFNDRINKNQAFDLLEDLRECDYPAYCIHGRNTTHTLSTGIKSCDFRKMSFGI